jgi:hypothetical protein
MQFLAKVLTCLLACLLEPLGGVVTGVVYCSPAMSEYAKW